MSDILRGVVGLRAEIRDVLISSAEIMEDSDGYSSEAIDIASTNSLREVTDMLVQVAEKYGARDE